MSDKVKMMVEEIKILKSDMENVWIGNLDEERFVLLADTALSLYHENDMLKTLLSESRADNTRLSRYEKAWKKINELSTPDELAMVFLAYSLDKIEKECGIEEDA